MLSDIDKGQILTYSNSRMSLQRIIDNIKHSQTAILSFLLNPITFGGAKSTG